MNRIKMKLHTLFFAGFLLLTSTPCVEAQSVHQQGQINDLRESLTWERLPDLEIDENENTKRILEQFFDLISERWSGGSRQQVDEFIEKIVTNLEAEFDSKVTRANKRLLELKHLIDCQPSVAPYFASFYFRQIVDLRESVNRVECTLQAYRLRLDNDRKQLSNSLLMVKELQIEEPELRWQKNWISHNVEPLVANLDDWVKRIDTMIARSQDFQKKVETLFKKEENKIHQNYEKYYSHQFDYFGSTRGTGLVYQYREVISQFEEWQYTFDTILRVILPNTSFVNSILRFLILTLLIGILVGNYLYRKYKADFSYYLRPFVFLFLGIFFAVGVYLLPSTNDIIIFTFAGGCLTLALVDVAWKLRKKWTNASGFNPLLTIVPTFVVIDVLTSMLIPVKVLLTVLILLAVVQLCWNAYLFCRYKYPVSETILAGIMASIVWIISALTAWYGYLYPSMMVTVIAGLIICIFYSGTVITQFLVTYAARLSSRRLLTSFVFTLIIPLVWLTLFVGGIRWLGQIFNAGRILEIFYNANLIPSPSIEISPKLVLFLILLSLSIKFVLNWVQHMLEIFSSTQKLDSGSMMSAFLIFQYLVWTVFVVYVLDSLHIDWNNIRMVIGGLSVGFGFALKDLLENFVCGLILLIGKEVRPGDVVEFDGTMGHVEKINIRATFIKTFDNSIITLPNNQVVSKDFRNWTLNGHVMRQNVDVGVAYGSDIEKVVKLMLEAADESKMVMHVKKPEVLFWSFGDSALIFRLRIWIHVDNIVKAPSAIRLIIDDLFRKNNITIAFPQLDVHFDESLVTPLPNPLKEP